VEPQRWLAQSEKDAVSAQKLGQLQPFTAVFPQDCTGHLASRQRLTLFSRKGSYCGWEGVTCAAGGGGHDVAALNLTKNALRGTMRLALSG
jgi:hypothetical protein